MNYATVCSGIECASVALSGMGWRPVFFSEIEPFPCELLKQRYPGVPNLGDMRKINAKGYAGSVDVLAGGTPCQDLSVAGRRAGFDGERSVLAIDFVRICYELHAPWLVWENVVGALSCHGGGDFATLLSLFCGYEIKPCGWGSFGIAQNGGPDRYGVAWRVLDGQYTRVDSAPRGIPQRRRRVWLVGHLGDWEGPAKVLLEPEGLLGDTPPRRETPQGNTEGSGKRAEIPISGIGCLTPDDHNGGRCYGVNGAYPTMFTNGHSVQSVTYRYQSMGQYTPGGGSSSTLLARLNKGVGGGGDLVMPQYGNKAGTLAARADSSPCSDRGQNVVPAVRTANTGANGSGVSAGSAHTLDAAGPEAVAFSCNQRDEVRVTGGKVCALQAQPGMKQQAFLFEPRFARCGSGQPRMADATHTLRAASSTSDASPCVAVPINSMVIGKRLKDGDRQTTGIGKPGDPSPTIGAAQHQAVACFEKHGQDTRYRQLKGSFPSIPAQAGIGGNNLPFVAGGMVVRRLTPVECERLMGLPDDYTRIAWRGRPPEECPDAPRYRACGNGWMTNQARWVFQRIEKVQKGEL